MISFLVTLLVIVIIGGILYWIITLLPFPQPFKNIALVICLLILLLWVLSMFGVFGGSPRPLFNIRN